MGLEEVGVTTVEEEEEVTAVEEVMVVGQESMVVEEAVVQEVVPLASSVVRKVTGPGTVHRAHQVGEVEEGLLGGKAPHRMVEGEVEVLERAISAANQATSAMPAPTRMNTIRRYSTTELLYIVQAMLPQYNLTDFWLFL